MRKKDSNPHKQSQSLSCYLYTIPQYNVPLTKRIINYTKLLRFVNPYFQIYRDTACKNGAVDIMWAMPCLSAANSSEYLK